MPNIFYCLNAVEKKMQVNEQSQFIRFSEYPWNNMDKVLKRLIYLNNQLVVTTTTS